MGCNILYTHVRPLAKTDEIDHFNKCESQMFLISTLHEKFFLTRLLRHLEIHQVSPNRSFSGSLQRCVGSH